MRTTLLIALLATIAPAALAATECSDKPECWPDGSAMRTGLQAGVDLKKADRELNATYQRIVKSLPDDQDDNFPKRTLIAAQREWVKFRDANCAAIGEVSGGVRMWKSSYDVLCQLDMTKARTAELKTQYEGSGR
jgi:uncharacterized protein YecT (DUF1311 family)